VLLRVLERLEDELLEVVLEFVFAGVFVLGEQVQVLVGVARREAKQSD